MSIQTGSCLCGNIKIEFTDAPIKRILCHCLDCRKITGCHYSDNGVVVDEQFKLVSGTAISLTTLTLTPTYTTYLPPIVSRVLIRPLLLGRMDS